MSRLLILGAGGHGKVVADAALEQQCWSAIAFADDRPAPASVLQLPVAGSWSDLRRLQAEYPEAVVAIGDNVRRLELIGQLRDLGFGLPVIRHPRAVVARDVRLGAGSVLFAGSVINAGTVAGDGLILNTAAVIDHDCVLGDGVHLSPGSRLAGNVTVEDRVWIGIGANVIEGRRIGAEAIVGAGAAVIDDVAPYCIAVGVPARTRPRDS